MKLPSDPPPRELVEITKDFPHRLIFVTVSGAHLYGFESPDSDVDLRGCHVLPPHELLGLRSPRETVERMGLERGIELDLVSHDAGKFFRMLLKRNGYVLEQLLSPLVVVSSPEHEELIALAPRLLTRHHSHHYFGFARTQWDLFVKEPRVKTLLYTYRVLLTGIHLMRAGVVEASLVRLLEDYPQEGVGELIAAKKGGAEKQTLDRSEVARHAGRIDGLVAKLQESRDQTDLPDASTAFDEVDALLLRVRGVSSDSA